MDHISKQHNFFLVFSHSANSGSGSIIADEGVAIYEVVREQVEANQSELKSMEEAVKEQLSGKPKKKKKKKKSTSKKGSASSYDAGTTELVGGVEVNLGEIDFEFDDMGSDSDGGDSTGLLNL